MPQISEKPRRRRAPGLAKQGAEIDHADEKLSDALVFEVAKRWLLASGEEQKKLTTGIAEWLVDHHSRELPWVDQRWNRKRQVDLTRYRIYKIVRQAIERGFVQLNAPQTVLLRDQLVERYRLDKTMHDIRVVDVADDVNDMVAQETAETALQLILKLARRNAQIAEEQKQEPEPVGIGLGAGYSSLAVVKYLAKKINAMPNPPRLRLHALTASIVNPKISPVTFFSLFRNDRNEYVDLPTSATVRCRDYEALKQQDKNIQNAFALRDRVQLIITSLGAADDEHGTIRSYIDYRQDHPELLREELIGDLQYLPYSWRGPISLSENRGWRAVTLFDWDDMQRFAADEDHYLVICAAPCRQCHSYKTKAIVPLLEHIRVWTHLVTDRATAEQLLAIERGA
jgi:DNA-binding transcriptional regulator LsrR (DeoR family)